MEKLVFSARLSGSLEGMSQKLSSLPFYASEVDGQTLRIARVESRNIKKMPYLFYIIEISPDSLTVTYSIPAESSETMRRAEMLKNVSSVVSLVSDQYTVEQGALCQYMNSTIESILSGISQPYSTLFNQYNSTLGEYKTVKKLNEELSASNRNLTVQASQLNEENKKLGEELMKLQKYSDESLMVMIQDWVEVHNNTIDIEEFGKTYSISPPRVEEILDRMVSMGYLELRS